MSEAGCIFCRIARGELPAKLVYEDEYFVAFPDIHPSAPVHLLLVPKAHVANLYDVDASHEPMLGRMLATAGRLAREHGSDDGFRIIINNGRVGRQEVYHLHLHLLGGPDPLGGGLPRPPGA